MIPLIWSQSSAPNRSHCCTILGTSNLLKDARKGGKDNKEENLVETEWEGEGDKKPLCRVTPSRWPEVGWASNRLTLTKPTEELSHPAPPHHCPMVMRLSEAPGVSVCGPLIHCDMGKKALRQQRYHRDGWQWREATQEHAMGRTCARGGRWN